MKHLTAEQAIDIFKALINNISSDDEPEMIFKHSDMVDFARDICMKFAAKELQSYPDGNISYQTLLSLLHSWTNKIG